MYSASSVGSFQTVLNGFELNGKMMRYSRFAPRLYNLCLAMGMKPGKIMPSRAFCSDESQGFPIILITKQFGTFPFNHGLVGGVVATDLHEPHSDHGKDMVIIQASHVGYEPETDSFGIYRRINSSDCHHSTNCGKIADILQWYRDEYAFARQNILLEMGGQGPLISINNHLLRADRSEGLFLRLPDLIEYDTSGNPALVRTFSTARCFKAAPALLNKTGPNWPTEGRRPIGVALTPDLFSFKRDLVVNTESQGHLEQNLLDPMPWIVTDPSPELAAAQINTQIEFDRTYRSIISHKSYQKRNLIFIAGLNIDISPKKGQVFPLTKFIPWAAYIQTSDGKQQILEQQELFDTLNAQSIENPNEINLEQVIDEMMKADEVAISFKSRR